MRAIVALALTLGLASSACADQWSPSGFPRPLPIDPGVGGGSSGGGSVEPPPEQPPAPEITVPFFINAGADTDYLGTDAAAPVCSPSTQTVAINVQANLTASAGNGTFSWSAPGGSPSTGTGSSFGVTYTTAGTKTITVTSDGLTDICTVVATDTAPACGAATGQFVVQADRICDPSGNVFRLHAVDIFPQDVGAGHVTDLVDCWQFNGIVVKWMGFDSTWPDYTAAEIDTMIDTYRAEGLVVIVQRAGQPGSRVGQGQTIDQDDTIAQFSQLYAAHASDPYVWWSPFAEPLSNGAAVIDSTPPTWDETVITRWVGYFNDVAASIRAAGSNSPILISPPIWAADGIRLSNANLYTGGPLDTGPSARYIMLRDWDRFTFTNKMVETHPWLWFKPAVTQAIVDEYFDAHLQAGIHVDLGDLVVNTIDGTRRQEAMDYLIPYAQAGYSASYWHWNHGGSDNSNPRNNLTVPTGVENGTGNGDDIDSCSAPTNLSADFGQRIWNLNHP